MWRVLSIVEEMSQSLNQAAGLLEDALRVMDQEMGRLQERLHADARSLREDLERVALSDCDRGTLLVTLDRIEATAETVAAFVHRRPEDEAIDNAIDDAIDSGIDSGDRQRA
jgi:hypothetical protein